MRFKTQNEYFSYHYGEKIHFNEGQYWSSYKSARILLEKANIVKNTNLLTTLFSEYEYLVKTDSKNTDDIFSDMMFRVMEYYDYIADELIIVGAFEQYAKSILLENDIVVHIIDKPALLKKKQKNEPVNFISYTDQERITIFDNSINISTIVNNESYYKLINMNNTELDNIREMIKIRNRVHLNTIGIININMKIIDFVSSFYKKLMVKESEKEKLVFKK